MFLSFEDQKNSEQKSLISKGFRRIFMLCIVACIFIDFPPVILFQISHEDIQFLQKIVNCILLITILKFAMLG
jgi:hypothetical protein